MKQVVITRHGGPEVLQIMDRPERAPGPGEVKIAVKAAGINFADILARKGIYPDAPKPPCVVGYEVSGIVTEVGVDTDTSLLDKPVIALTRFGGYSQTVVVPAVQVFEMPAGLSFEEAASIPIVYLTAYQLLVVMGGLKAGETVLIHNAGGAVGLAALDIAIHLKANAIGTASASKHSFLKQRGLGHAVDYRSQDWMATVMELTENRGVELVIDPIGGAHFRKSYRVLRSTGRLGMFGISSASEGKLPAKLNLLKLLIQLPFFHPLGLMNSNKGVFGVNLGHLWNEQQKVKRWADEILNGVRAGWVRPHVDSVFTLKDAPRAHTYIEQRKNIGKVILSMP